MNLKNLHSLLLTLALSRALFKTEQGDDDFAERITQHAEKLRRLINELPSELHNCLNTCLTNCPTERKKSDLGLNCLAPCLKTCSPENKEAEANFEMHRKLKATLDSLPKNFCTNGLDARESVAKLSLLEFAKGPCSPVILVPGVTATRLVINIDCEIFQASEQKAFAQCGWNACSKSRYQFWKSVPEPEYALWIPTLMSPLSIFTLSERSNLCFASLIKPHYKLDKPISEMFEARKGVKINFEGFSPKTKTESLCGGNALQNLLPISYQIRDSQGFAPLIKALEHVGYVSGLTMQALPYNFYYSYRNNEFVTNFGINLERLNKLTGKKVTFIAHSMGNINILHNLKSMSKEDKRGKIFNWVSIGAPFLGTPKAQKTLISGNDDYITLNGYFGFHFRAFVLTTSNQMSLYELTAYDPFKIYEGQKWFEGVKKRVEYEKEDSGIPFEESGIPFWPKKEEVCHEANLEAASEKCLTGIYNTLEEKIIEIGEESFRIQDSQQMIRNFNLTYNSPYLYEKLYDESLTLTNPEIPVILVFAGSIATQNYFKFAGDFKQKIAAEIYPKPLDIGHTVGDGTVPAYSAILPGLKWAFEFAEGGNSSFEAQPVKFVEFCGIGNSYSSIYDEKPTDKPFGINKNEYIGLNCDCNFQEKVFNYNACGHAGMHGDSNVIKLVFDVVAANQRASEETIKYIESLDPFELEQSIFDCEHIKPNIFD